MTGEILAILAAIAYGMAGVAIVRGKPLAKGDNGVFLSVVLTAVLSLLLWSLWGKVPAAELLRGENLAALGAFVAAGFASTVVGRITMYRATELIGAVPASLLRRLTPVFAVPFAMVFLSEAADVRTIAGGALVLSGVIIFLCADGCRPVGAPLPGLALGVASSAFYALAYTLRSLGMEKLPDPALGAFIGAGAGILWFALRSVFSSTRSSLIQKMWCDRGAWHLLAALLLSAGQVLQFFALQTATVATVAVLGTLEVLFAAVFVSLLIGPQRTGELRLLVSAALAVAGTAMLF